MAKPQEYSVPNGCLSDNRKWKNALKLSCLLAVISLATHYFPFAPRISQWLPKVPQRHDGGSDNWCPLPDVTVPPDDGLKPSEHFDTPTQLALQVKRLSAAVRVPTESYDDNGDVDEDPRWAMFGDLHERLKQLFPLVHAQLELRKINRYGLLYTWSGTNPSLKPVLLTAHQDVVPAAPESSWTYPPYSGHYDGAFLWGRGAADCKNVLIGILSVVEALLLQSFSPRRTIVLAFGFDEETGGLQGAAPLSQALEDEWGPESFIFLLDEGGMGVQSLGDVMYAYPGVGEKGYYDVQLSLDMTGGHSSRPPTHTAIGIMADAIVALEKDPYFPQLTQSSPFRRVLECRAKYSPDQVQPWLRDSLIEGEEKDIAKRLAEHDPDDKWLMQTSQAIDVITGGVKINALPQHVELLINHRVAPHESIQYVNSHIHQLLSPVARKHGLHMKFFNMANPDSHVSSDSTSSCAPVLDLSPLQALPPAPVSPTDNGVWAVFSGTLRSVFESTESGRGKLVVPVGNIMTGNTDTVHYWNLTRNIYRYTPARLGTRLNAHGINERMEIMAHIEGMRVYYDLIRNFDVWNGE